MAAVAPTAARLRRWLRPLRRRLGRRLGRVSYTYVLAVDCAAIRGAYMHSFIRLPLSTFIIIRNEAYTLGGYGQLLLLAVASAISLLYEITAPLLVFSPSYIATAPRDTHIYISWSYTLHEMSHADPPPQHTAQPQHTLLQQQCPVLDRRTRMELARPWRNLH